MSARDLAAEFRIEPDILDEEETAALVAALVSRMAPAPQPPLPAAAQQQSPARPRWTPESVAPPQALPGPPSLPRPNR